MTKLFPFLCSVLTLVVRPAALEETAVSLAQKLQSQFLTKPGVILSFDLKSEGHLRLMADFRGGRIRVESPSLLIISDGKTIWNYDKTADRVTIDNVAGASTFRDPSAFFRFADNYSATMVKHAGSDYTVSLTPRSELQSLAKAAGELQSLVLELRVAKHSIKILSASAISSRGKAHPNALSIVSMKSVRASDFIFTPKASTKVVDLRE